MIRTIVAVCTLSLFGWGSAHAQLDVSVDTLTVIESTTISYQGLVVDYFLVDLGDAAIIFIEDSAFVKMLGFIEGVDTMLLPEATVWMRTSGAQVGDSWAGVLPLDQMIFTQEEIVGTKMVTVGAGTFLVFDIGVWDLDGQYLGEKWYSDGIGLVGWDINICNETHDLQVLEFDLSGAGFWPHAFGDTWIYDERTNRTWVTAPVASIVVDGSMSDWVGVSPVVQDSPGDDTSIWPGSDISDLFAAVNNDTLYMAATFWDGAPDTGFASGYPFAYSFVFDDEGFGTLWGYSVAYEPEPVSEWYVSGLNLSVAGARAAVGEAVEMAVPISSLGFFTFEIPNFLFAVDSSYADVTCYHRVRLEPSCSITLTGDVNINGAISSSDIITLVNYVFKAGPTPLPCLAAGDVNCNGAVSSSDIIYIVNRVFKAGPEPCDACSLIPGTWSCP